MSRSVQITHRGNDETLTETCESAAKEYFQEEGFYTCYPYSSDKENVSVRKIPHVYGLKELKSGVFPVGFEQLFVMLQGLWQSSYCFTLALPLAVLGFSFGGLGLLKEPRDTVSEHPVV